MSAIDKLILRNFKAFYSGTENYEVNFSGKHMLIYGENGSGKSSIYWSLYTLFQSENKTDAEIKKYFEPINDEQLVNYNYLLEHPSFEIDDEGKIKEPKSIGKNSEVEVILKNGVSLKINEAGKTETEENIIENLNRHSDFISHRLLINFYNFRNSKEINLWEVFVRDFFPFLKNDKGNGAITLNVLHKEIFLITRNPEFFGDAFSALKDGTESEMLNDLKSKIDDLNSSIEYYINILNDKGNEFFENNFKSLENDFNFILVYSIGLNFFEKQLEMLNVIGDLRYKRWFNEPLISLKIKDNTAGVIMHRPQAYLNEAKLTQIALAIRFSLLDNTLRPPFDGQFLVLDDLLVSLDMSNRDKVLDIILNLFSSKYKIYMFTHERAFFNMAKARIESEHNKDNWFFKELYGIDEEHNTPQINNSDDFLTKSIFQYKQKDYPASVNYLRKELEKVLNDNLPGKVKKGDNGEDKSTLDSIITSAIIYLEKLDINPLPLKKCQQYLQILLNPLSHNEDDVDAYETDIKRIRKVIEELKPFLIDIKKRTKEIFPRLRKISLTITENDTVTQQKYTLELQEELYLITEANGDIRLSECKINSIESRTFISGELQIKDDGNYKNERWKSNSFEDLFNSICNYKEIVIVPNYIDFFETLEGVKVNTLL